MEDALHQLLSFPSPSVTAHETYETHARDFIASTREVLANAFDGSDKFYSLLDHVDPSTHSLSYLLLLNFLILETKRKSPKAAFDDLRAGRQLLPRTLTFLNTFDPSQISYAANEYRNILGFILKVAEMENKPFVAVRPIKNAIFKLDPASSTLTIAHVYLARMSLLARAYKLARPVLDQTIFAIPSAADQLTYTDHMKYFLYGGMIYMALKEWSKARHFLSIVISSPVINSISRIMVEAYKKWVLVNLLENGTTASPPKVTSPLALKVFKALARPYDALATAFISGKWEKLRDEAEFGQTIWRTDKNNGLVQQVLIHFRRQAVRGLGSTFAAVTTTDVSERALSNTMDVLETERFIVALAIQEGFATSLIHPSKDSKASMLRFLTDRMEPSIDIEVSLEEQLRLQHQKLEHLARSVQASDRKLEFSKEYVNYLRKTQKRNDATSKDGGFVGRPKDQNIDIDEDMMDDLQ
ncbi:hypothetical protein UA08_04378 [Talaromyces atroroseus]|uniref:COP9 signalosome complex subunit 3 N-terminal helical repeats domain-containing protein n=1 Tax=Talaromyces atroroseus TaxID=1441469 RepID=A0A1Q5Q8F8_TALAT|nr:hypothetical protein UA08_04378 [Talaromyces atroroseus]OKL60416.1 hypothetical protein UA08_04378 [Talaromyces atroroseus]